MNHPSQSTVRLSTQEKHINVRLVDNLWSTPFKHTLLHRESQIPTSSLKKRCPDSLDNGRTSAQAPSLYVNSMKSIRNCQYNLILDPKYTPSVLLLGITSKWKDDDSDTSQLYDVTRANKENTTSWDVVTKLRAKMSTHHSTKTGELMHLSSNTWR